MDNIIEALKTGLAAWGYLFLTMMAIFGVLVIVKRIGKK